MNAIAIGTNRICSTNQTAAAPATSSASEPSAPTLMPDPLGQLSSSADVVAQIAAMLIRSLREDRNAARMKSAAEEVNIRREGDRRVAKLHEKADAIRSQGWASGVGQIGAGVLAGGGAAMQFGGMNLPAGSNSQRALNGWEKTGNVLSGSRDASSGMGTIVSKQYEAEAGDLEADAEQHKVNADLASKRQQQVEDDVRDARELLSKVADFLRECNGARNNARQQASSIRV